MNGAVFGAAKLPVPRSRTVPVVRTIGHWSQLHLSTFECSCIGGGIRIVVKLR